MIMMVINNRIVIILLLIIRMVNITVIMSLKNWNNISKNILNTTIYGSQF